MKVLTFNDIGQVRKTISDRFTWVFITTYTNQLPLILETLNFIAEDFPNTRVVLGGVHASFAPESFERSPYHLLVRGEGERFFQEFLDGGDYLALPGVFQKGDPLTHEFAPLVENLDALPYTLRYLKSSVCGYRLDILAQRGCTYACSYCVNNANRTVYGPHLRYRAPENVMGEILQARNQRYYRHLLFLDENFILKRDWLSAFLPEYKKRVKMRFSIKIRPSLVTAEVLAMLRGTGCMSLQMGIECGDFETRRTILCRNESDEQIVEAFQLARRNGFKTYSYNMLGLPDDTEESIQKLINLNRRANPDVIDYSLFNPYPGTRLHDYYLQKNVDCPMTDSNLRWEVDDVGTLPNLPGISRERLAYYLKNFVSLIKNH